MCLFGLQISGVSPRASQRLPTLSQTFIAGSICLTKNKIWVFHPVGRGICPILLYPNTRDLLLLLFYTTVSLDFERCLISELTTPSPRMVNNSTMHPHPTQRDMIVHVTPQISGVIFFFFFIQELNVQLFYIPKYMKLHCSNIFYKMFLKATTRPSSYSRPRGSAVFLCT